MSATPTRRDCLPRVSHDTFEQVNDKTLAAWRLWQESQGLSQRTITERAAVIRHLLEYSGADPLTLTPDHIVAYTARPELSPASKGTYHASIRAFCRWLVQTERRADDPSSRTPRPKRPKGRPRPVHDNQLEALLAQVNRRRTRLMILLAALAGLRVHEIAKVRGEDFDLANDVLTVVGKGGKLALLPLHERIASEVSTFPRHGWLFPAYGDNRTAAGHIEPQSVSLSIMRTMRRAGVDGKAHQLRHWYATSLLAAGADLRIVQELMRHESPATTAIYTKVDMTQQMAALTRLRLPQASSEAVAA